MVAEPPEAPEAPAQPTVEPTRHAADLVQGGEDQAGDAVAVPFPPPKNLVDWPEVFLDDGPISTAELSRHQLAGGVLNLVAASIDASSEREATANEQVLGAAVSVILEQLDS